MKRVLLVFIIYLAFLSSSIGQGLLDDNSIEITIEKSWNTPFFENKIDTELIFNDLGVPDSLTIGSMRGKYYLYSPAFGNFNYYNPFKPKKASMEGILVKEDHIYLRFISQDNLFDTLVLFYDFSIQIGDSFPVLVNNIIDYEKRIYYVVNREPMEMVDGSKQTSIKLETKTGQKMTWIKGLGSLEYGFNMSYQDVGELGYEAIMVCVGNNRLLYKKHLIKPGVDSTCRWPATLGITDNLISENIKIINPVSAYPKVVSTQVNHSMFISVYDQKGDLLLNEPLIGNRWEFNHKEVTPGLYLIQVYDENTGEAKRKRVSKNN